MSYRLKPPGYQVAAQVSILALASSLFMNMLRFSSRNIMELWWMRSMLWGMLALQLAQPTVDWSFSSHYFTVFLSH